MMHVVLAGLLAHMFLSDYHCLCDAQREAQTSNCNCNTGKETVAISSSNIIDYNGLSQAVIQQGVTLLKQIESQQKQDVLISALITKINSLTASVTTLEQEKKELMVTAQGLTKMTQSLKKEITEYKERLAELEQSANARALLDASQQCTSDREGVLLFTSATHQLKVCSNSQWIAGYKPPPKGSLSNVAYSCGEVAANPENRINGSYYVYVNWIPVQVHCDLIGGNGLSRASAGMTCNTIRKYWLTGHVRSSMRWINPSMTQAGAFLAYCDFQSFGGGWTLLYSSRDDGSGNNNMQKGNHLTAHTTSLDPGNANKRFPYPEFKAIDNSLESYSEVMLSGYQDYRNKGQLIRMYFNKTPRSGLSFTQFIDWGIGRDISGSDRCTTTGSYYGIEKSSGKAIALTWENYAFIAGAGSSGCAWNKEVWNEIDGQGGHLLAPQDWGRAESYSRQTSSAGACHNVGVYHIFVR